MQIKSIRPFKMSLLERTSIFVASFAILFFVFSAAPLYAQFTPVYVNGVYTYPYTNNFAQLYVTTNNATTIGISGATLSGRIYGSTSLQSYAATWFEYGTTTSLGYSTTTQSTYTYSSVGYNNFSASISGLYSGTLYYFRAAAQGPQGVVYGSINSFTTRILNPYLYNPNIYSPVYNPVVYNPVAYNPVVYNPVVNTAPSNPTAITEGATSVYDQSAELNALIVNSQNDYNTNTWFEWGTGSSLSNKTTPVSVGALASAKHVNVMTGLAPGTAYYYRAVVENSAGKNVGSTLNFVTSGTKPSTVVYVPAPVTTSTITSAPATYTSPYIYPTPTPATNTGAQSPLTANASGAGYLLPNNSMGGLTAIVFVLILILLGILIFYKIVDNRPRAIINLLK